MKIREKIFLNSNEEEKFLNDKFIKNF